MPGYLHLHALCPDGSSQFSGRIGSIISELRPAIALTDDGVPPTTSAPQDFQADFDALKASIASAAGSVGRIQTDEATPRVLASCFRVGADPRRVVTARHVALALLQPRARLLPGEAPVIEPARSAALMPLVVVFEANGGDPAETHRIAAIELSHGVMDLMLLRLDGDSARPPLPLADALEAEQAQQAPVCVIGYPVRQPPASDDTHFEALFSLNGAIVTGIKRASPGFLQAAPSPPDPADFLTRHDATTLQGSSGSAVIRVDDGGLIGLHIRGKDGVDRNEMIYLPSALAEPALRERFDPGFAGTHSPLPTWPAEAGNIVIGSPRLPDLTADELAELPAIQPAADVTRAPSVAPGLNAYSPAVMSDRRDIRDRPYDPPLLPPRPVCLPDPPDPASIRRQWQLSDCTGCALAVTIERALVHQGRPMSISTRMLYEMARLHDEFVDDLPQGSSLRGAIKGFFHNGACKASDQDRLPDWFLSVARAHEAREVTLGSYYRLRPGLPDFQMAIQETGAVIVAAETHSGWRAPGKGQIIRRRDRRAAHAFVLIGYDQQGFLIQNSWGKDWGGWIHPETGAAMPGVAHWSYADWADSVMDAWVLQIAPPAPQAHNLPLRAYLSPKEPRLGALPPEIEALPQPRRLAILGHIAHVERGGLIDAGRIGVGARSIRETAIHLSSDKTWTDPEKAYGDLVFLFHDPTLGAEATARLAAHWVPRLKAARCYPMNILYGADEIRSLTARMMDEARFAAELGQGGPDDLTAFLERRARTAGGALLQAYLDGLETAADRGGALWSLLAGFGVEAILPPRGLRKPPRRIHVVGLGLGALAAHACFGRAAGADRYGIALGATQNPASVSLMGPVGLPGSQITDPEAWRPLPKGRAPRLRVERLDPDRPKNVVLDRYRGDWTDLVASMLDAGKTAPRSTDGRARNPATLAAMLTDREVLNRVARTITAKPRLAEWVAF